ncbi:glutamate racemase [Butyrivibrio proteoclasticus]|uniref:Glutamate racemase n=1 Tax=Butyrivibrio proteoclasticus TaxID=43305 RepID=A0A1I5TVI9_9FIRM|nr:glutamate racemase [Butyrivibrio proteoclasticus]SFP86921.1 glutamate racemase [Butyrivibrio proteoclasticus]
MKIGIFDSGIGGLSVLHEAYHQLPEQEFIFYADTEHVPYGLKTKEQIMEYAIEITEFLLGQGVDAIVIACNTATSVAVKELRKRYSLPILGMEPAVKPAVEGTDKKRIMVIATPVTIREDKLKNLLHRVDEDHRVDLLPMPKLVEFAEREEFESEEVREYIYSQFSEYDKDDYSALVLGCTHFNYFKPIYRDFFGPDTHLIDGNFGTIRHLADVLNIPLSSAPDKVVYFEDYHNMLCDTKTTYFFSGKNNSDEKMLKHLCRLHNRLEDVRKIK